MTRERRYREAGKAEYRHNNKKCVSIWTRGYWATSVFDSAGRLIQDVTGHTLELTKQKIGT